MAPESYGESGMSDINKRISEISSRLHETSLQQLIDLVSEQSLITRLTSGYTRDLELEAVLIELRKRCLQFLMEQVGQLDAKHPGTTQCLCALAIQCYYNEYIFSVSESEQQQLDELIHHISHEQTIPDAVTISVIACYQPLHLLPFADTIQDQTYNHSVLFEHLLHVQITEPYQQAGFRKTINQLAFSVSDISARVQTQYEQNPYPCWQTTEPVTVMNLELLIQQQLDSQYDMSRFFPQVKRVLIAGCGTGKTLVENAQRFPASKVTGIDLSLSSLAYACRMADVYELDNVELYQADLHELPESWEVFDYIESVGVLSHLDNPVAGITALSEKLVEGGVMKLNLYSRAGRAFIHNVRTLLSRHDEYQDNQQLRKARQDIISELNNPDCQLVTQMSDFYSLSEFRDMLFHVHETEVDRAWIEKTILDLGLDLLGFETATTVQAGVHETFWVQKPR